MKTDRNFTLKLIYDYFNGKINNFELDESFPNSTDPLITNIAETFWYFYDDTRKHIWLDFYDSEVKMIVSIWIYLLKNDLTWQQIEEELPPKYSGSHYWLSLLEKAQTNFWNESNIFVVYMPPITLALLKKCIDFNQISFYLFPRFFIRKYLKKMKAIINERNESDCQSEWEENGYHYEDAIKKIVDSGLYINKSVIKKILPFDSTPFMLTGEILQKEAYLFSRGKIDDHKVNQLFDTL